MKQPLLQGLDFKEKEVLYAIEHKRLLKLNIEIPPKNEFCNLDCIYCCVKNNESEGPKKPLLKYKQIKDIISQAKDLGAKTIAIVGAGEPLLNKRMLFEIIEFVNSNELKTILYTNATLITKAVAKELMKNNVSVVAKLNSLDRKTQDFLCGRKDSYTLIMNGISNLINAGYGKLIAKEETPLTNASLETVIVKQNIKKIPKLWKFARGIGFVPEFQVVTFAGNANKNMKKLEISAEDVKNLTEKIIEIEEEHGYDCAIRSPFICGRSCINWQTSIYVTCDGTIVPCISLRFPLGNIRKEKLKEIIEKPKVRIFKKIHKTINGKCSACKMLKEGKCFGGCRANAYYLTGKITNPDPLCPL